MKTAVFKDNHLLKLYLVLENGCFQGQGTKESVDFLDVKRVQMICPIEVRSSGYKTHKSLDLFCEKYSDRIRNRYLMYTKDLSKDGALQMVPVYMAPFL